MPGFKPRNIILHTGLKIGIDKDRVPMNIIASLFKGDYEAQEAEVANAILKPSDRVLELGSGIGFTSMKAAQIVGPENVLSFEANPYLLEWSRDNFARNELPVTVRPEILLPKATHTGDPVDFYVHPAFWASSLIKLGPPARRIKVPTACFEDMINQHRANVLIADIEGGEYELLMKADLSAIEKIIVEVHYQQVGKQKTNSMVEYLVSQGFFLDYSISAKSVLGLYRLPAQT